MAPRTSTGWRVVAGAEITELWCSAKALSILLGFTTVLAALSYLAAANAGINLLDARESVGLVVKIAIGLSALGGMIVSADAIAGERERGTLEALLVTPTPRLGIVIGKLVSASSIWLASLIASAPFVVVLALGAGNALLGLAVLAVAGSLVSVALTAFGVAISARASSNRVSLAVCVATLLLLTAPSQLPAITTSQGAGATLIRLNPVSASLQLADNVVIQQQAWSEQWALLISPVGAAVLLTVVALASTRRVTLGGAR